jgi:SAM-dependent methyltransferase
MARAQAWSAHWGRRGAPAREAVADAAGIGAGTRLLDAGCGTGEFLALALERGADASGIDISSDMLAVARRHAPEADLREGDVTKLPFDDDAFDGDIAPAAAPYRGADGIYRFENRFRYVLAARS